MLIKIILQLLRQQLSWFDRAPAGFNNHGQLGCQRQYRIRIVVTPQKLGRPNFKSTQQSKCLAQRTSLKIAHNASKAPNTGTSKQDVIRSSHTYFLLQEIHTCIQSLVKRQDGSHRLEKIHTNKRYNSPTNRIYTSHNKSHKKSHKPSHKNERRKYKSSFRIQISQNIFKLCHQHPTSEVNHNSQLLSCITNYSLQQHPLSYQQIRIIPVALAVPFILIKSMSPVQSKPVNSSESKTNRFLALLDEVQHPKSASTPTNHSPSIAPDLTPEANGPWILHTKRTKVKLELTNAANKGKQGKNKGITVTVIPKNIPNTRSSYSRRRKLCSISNCDRLSNQSEN